MGGYKMKTEPVLYYSPRDEQWLAGFIHGGILYAKGFVCKDWEGQYKVVPFDPDKVGASDLEVME
jgi:hypothetical protein